MLKLGKYQPRQFLFFPLPFKSQIVTGVFDREQFRSCGNHFQGVFEFDDSSERIARSGNEERGSVQAGKMLGALLLRTARRVQWIGEQKQAGGEVTFLGAEHTSLTASVGVAGEEDSPFPPNERRVGRGILFLFTTPTLSQRRRQSWGGWGNLILLKIRVRSFSDCGDGVFQSGAVAGGVAGTGRAKGSHLAIGQVAAQDGEPGGAESLGQRDQQRSLRAAARTVREDEAAAVGGFRNMQESADGRVDRAIVKLADHGVKKDTF